jgi:DNA-binding transcriptional MerR regulator
MRIAELAELAGVTPRQLRHFETRGLLSPERDNRGWRDYDQRDRQRVEEINHLVSSGIPTELALRLLDSQDSEEHLLRRADDRNDGAPRSAYHDVLTDIVAFYRQLDARARCIARNRDGLAAWLDERGVHDVSN